MATTGIDPSQLTDEDLVRELARLHETRHDTFLHGSDDALSAHTERTGALEEEYLNRHPQRHVAAGRTRDGARRRD